MAVSTEEVAPELLREIAERSKTDPFFGAKVGAGEVLQRLTAAMKGERGVAIESLLCALASLAGYACQASLRAQARARGLAETALLVKVATKTGRTYFFGDELNRPLSGVPHSLWSLAGGAAQQAGCEALPELREIYAHCAAVVGTDAFGVPRVPEEHRPQELPLDYLRALWPAVQPLLGKLCTNPEHWPVLFGIALQEAIVNGKSALEPCLALRLVMECAIPMSKVDLTAA